MSSHASKKIDQKEYLKKYLSGDTNKKKKKVKKHKLKDSVKVKIIDDDAHAATELDIDEELLLTGEDAPQIVGSYIEENPNGSTRPKWKSIVIKDEEEEDEGVDVKPRIKVEEDLWGPKARGSRIKDEFSPERRKSPTPDLLPARRRRDNVSKDERRRRTRSRSKERKKKREHVSNDKSDNSPPRRKHDKRTPPRSKHSESITTERMRSLSSDQSPPRRRRKGSSTDKSPSRRRKIDSIDQSPPRNRKADMQHQNPARRRRQNSKDQSPPRKRNAESKDQSPPRRRRGGSIDQSPPRKRNIDLSPQRRRPSSPVKIKREKKSPDLSPTRKRNKSRERVSIMKHKPEASSRSIKEEGATAGRRSRWEPREPSRSISPPPTHGKNPFTKTLDGKRAGLQDAESLKRENQELRRREDELFAKMSSEMSGRDAEVQVRSEGRRGRRARQAKEFDPEEELRKEAHEKKKKELYDRWGKGLKQIEAHRTKVDEEQYESSKPLARHANDADLERHLREQERPDDPMLEYMRKKHKDRQKDSNVPTLPTYQGTFPENRFGLRPGYRWDGVDRSNGYEKKWFDKQNEKRAVQDEAYKYSVEDM